MTTGHLFKSTQLTRLNQLSLLGMLHNFFHFFKTGIAHDNPSKEDRTMQLKEPEASRMQCQ